MAIEKKAVVVGAGIGGIASAIRLRAMGYAVTIIERNDKIGGKLNELKWKNFRWDKGPSLFTLPELVDELFVLHDKNPQDYFQYNRLEIVCRYFFSDGIKIDAYNSAEGFAKEVEAKTRIKRGAILKYLKRSGKIYKLTAPVFIFDTFHKLNFKRIKKGLVALLNFHKLQAFSTMHKSNKKQLHEKKLVQLFDRFATYNGSNPYKAPATLNVIPYLEHCLGAYFPKHGMYDIIKAVGKLAEEVGVDFKLEEEVKTINHSNGAVVGVESDKAAYKCELVVSDSDIIPLYKLFEPTLTLPSKFLKHERSTSALIFYWAIDNSVEELDLHNIFFSEDYKEEFEYLFDKKTNYHDPTVYIFVSSKVVPGDAPLGKENWFVMINAPANVGQDWDHFIKKSRVAIIKKINRFLKVDVEDCIHFEEILDPRKIESQTSSFQGSLYGASSNSKWSAFQRHANSIKKIKGMYFVGGSVHPGGGIPLCLSSAKIVQELIREKQRSN